MPPIRTQYTQYLTPEQQTQLYHARVGDFILVERNNGYWFLLLIDAMSAESFSRAHLLVKSIQNPERQTIFDYHRFGTWHAMCSMWDQEPVEFTAMCAQDDRLTLRPSIGTLQDRLGGGCLYGRCRNGLVRIRNTSMRDVSFKLSTSRKEAYDAGRRPRTLCPFCMGDDLFERHEYLGLGWETQQFAMGVYVAHMQVVNSKRAQLGYDPLPPGLELNTLLYPQQAIEDAMAMPASDSSEDIDMVTGQAVLDALATISTPEGSMDTLTPSQSGQLDRPILSTHNYNWFKNARERVLMDICGICRERYQDGESITDLPCEHFFHERCMRVCLRYQRGATKCPFCSQALFT